MVVTLMMSWCQQNLLLQLLGVPSPGCCRLKTPRIQSFQDLQDGEVCAQVFRPCEQVLLCTVEALDVTRLVCFLEHETEEAYCGIATGHHFGQVGIHVKLNAATWALRAALRSCILLIGAFDAHLSACGRCLEEAHGCKVVLVLTLGRRTNYLLVANLSLAIKLGVRHWLPGLLLKECIWRVIATFLILLLHLHRFLLFWTVS